MWNYKERPSNTFILGPNAVSDHTDVFWPLRVQNHFWILDGVVPPLKSMKLSGINLDSLHFEISGNGMSQAVADFLSIIPSKNIRFIGLDIRYRLLCDVVEMEHLERLAEKLKNRDKFVKLHGIHARLEFQFGGFPFEPAAQALRGIFREKLLSVESLPHERRCGVRDVTDDSYQRSFIS